MLTAKHSRATSLDHQRHFTLISNKNVKFVFYIGQYKNNKTFKIVYPTICHNVVYVLYFVGVYAHCTMMIFINHIQSYLSGTTQREHFSFHPHYIYILYRYHNLLRYIYYTFFVEWIFHLKWFYCYYYCFSKETVVLLEFKYTVY